MKWRWPLHTKKLKEYDTFKEGRAPKDEGKIALFQRHIVRAVEGVKAESSKSTAELLAGREVLRAGLTSLRASFTVSLLGRLPVLCFVGAVFVCLFCLRYSFLFL